MFNDISESEIGKEPTKKVESNQNILKLADDTINFIDQELTKSYKQTNPVRKNSTSPNKNDEQRLSTNTSTASIGKHIVDNI